MKTKLFRIIGTIALLAFLSGCACYDFELGRMKKDIEKVKADIVELKEGQENW